MTISTPTTRIQYACDGVSTAYTVPFPFFGSAEIDALLISADQSTVTFLILNTHYTVAGGNGGTGTLNGGPFAAGATLVIYRLTNRTQLAELDANDDLPAATLETAFDRLAALAGEDFELFGRSIHAPVQDGPLYPLPPIPQRAGKALYFDGNGNPITLAMPGLPSISFQDIKSPLLPTTTFPEPWGFSPGVPYGGQFVQQSLISDAASPTYPETWIEAEFQTDVPLPLDYVGGYLASVPVGLYAQHVQTGTNTNNNAGTHSIMGYGINNAAGNNDCVAVSGRARKLEVTGGIGDACGVWGSAYNESTENGGVLGMEGHIYQNVPGMLPEDRLNAHWSVALHLYSDSLGSPAKALLALDAAGQQVGHYGAWNAIIIDKNIFGAGSGSNQGYVGINCGSWDGYNQPEFGIKFGECNCHIYGTSQLTLRGDDSIFFDQRTSGTDTSVIFDMGVGAFSNVVIRSNGQDIMRVLGADRTVHLHSAPIIDIP